MGYPYSVLKFIGRNYINVKSAKIRMGIYKAEMDKILYIDAAILILSESGKGQSMDSKKTRIELHCHSVYSERDGVSSVKDLLSVSYASGLSGMALTDRNSVAGYGEAMRYSRHLTDFQIIYGMEGFAVDDLDAGRKGNSGFIKDATAYHISFLIRNEIGKQNPPRIITMSKSESLLRRDEIGQFYGENRKMILDRIRTFAVKFNIETDDMIFP